MILRNFYTLLGIYLLGDGTSTNTEISVKNTSGTEKFLKLKNNHMTIGTQNNYSPTLLAVATTATTYGVMFGTGDTPVTFDDYKLSGTWLTSGFTYLKNSTCTVDETGIETTATYTITNNSDADITIKEVGLRALQHSTDGGLAQVLVERTVLDAPVVIEPGGVGQVHYTVRYDFPTAAATTTT